ncbi:hypothetical protein SALBM311S_03330 [Streptomyces alboniger]
MPKNKTHSGAKKRFRVTGSGKVLRQRAGPATAGARASRRRRSDAGERTRRRAGTDDLDDELDNGTMGRADRLGVRERGTAGCPRRPAHSADAVVRVPIHGKAESLNLATAAAVCLYASARAQRASGGCRSVTES